MSNMMFELVCLTPLYCYVFCVGLSKLALTRPETKIKEFVDVKGPLAISEMLIGLALLYITLLFRNYFMLLSVLCIMVIVHGAYRLKYALEKIMKTTKR